MRRGRPGRVEEFDDFVALVRGRREDAESDAESEVVFFELPRDERRCLGGSVEISAERRL